MAKRLALSLVELRQLDPLASETDARVIWKDGDEWNMSIKTVLGTQPLVVTGTRDMRLLAQQLLKIADDRDRRAPDIIEVEPYHEGLKRL